MRYCNEMGKDCGFYALELQKKVNNEVILHIPNLKMDLL